MSVNNEVNMTLSCLVLGLLANAETNDFRMSCVIGLRSSGRDADCMN